MPQGGGQGLVYIGWSVNPEPSDQTSLNKWHRCNLEGGGGTDVEAEADWCAQGIGGPKGGTIHLASSQAPIWWSIFWCPLKPFGVVYAMEKHDLI